MGDEQVMTTTSSKDASSSQAEEAPQRHPDHGQVLNASGHVQELERQFSLVSLAGIGLSVGIVWPAAGGSILVAIFNGGPPGQSSPIPVPACTNLLQESCTSSSSSPSFTGSLPRPLPSLHQQCPLLLVYTTGQPLQLAHDGADRSAFSQAIGTG